MSINKIYHNFETIYHKYNLNIIASIIGNLFMAILNLILIINGGSLFLIGAILFYLFMSILRGTSFIFYKKDKSIRKIGLFYAISSTFIYLLIPSLLAYVLSEKEYQPFFIDWFIYAYALYATLKMVFAFVHIKKTFVEKDIYLIDIKVSNLVLAFYTIFLLAFNLINAYGSMDNEMFGIMIFINVLVIISAIIALIIMYRILKWGKNND